MYPVTPVLESFPLFFDNFSISSFEILFILKIDFIYFWTVLPGGELISQRFVFSFLYTKQGIYAKGGKARAQT